jgi:hypothetical protein
MVVLMVLVVVVVVVVVAAVVCPFPAKVYCMQQNMLMHLGSNTRFLACMNMLRLDCP